MVGAERYSIREFAHDLITTQAGHGTDLKAFAAEASPFVTRFLQQPDLLTLGVERQAYHADSSNWLYYDKDLQIHISPYIRSGTRLPTHNHYVWELVGVYKGGVEHTLYERVDDEAEWGTAELSVIEQGHLRRGDVVAAIPPKADIHDFVTTAPETYLLAVTGGSFPEVRRYFDPETNEYFDRPVMAYRKARGLS